MKTFITYHFPAILYGLLILVLSSIPKESLPEISLLRADKLMHFLEYALFAILIYRSFTHLLTRFGTRYVFLASFVFMLLFSMLDEAYQNYVPGRHSDILDIILDVLGASLILVLLWIRQKRRYDKKAAKGL